MNLDIFSTTYGQTTINIKLAHILGLQTALYVSVITDALYQAKKKNKVSEEGYFTIDRKYVHEVSTLTTPEQKQCEKILTTLGYLVNGNKANSISVDIGGLVRLITEDDPTRVAQIQAVISQIAERDKEAERVEAMSKNLKAKITETDLDIANALYGWVDSLEGKANTKTVEIFQTELNKYTRDKKVKLELIRRATLSGYRDLNWVISGYEKDTGKNNLMNKPVTPPQNVAKDLSEVDLTRKF